jgi:hypothetical protein
VAFVKKYQHARVKFNGGVGGLLCNGCGVILKYGFTHQDFEHFCERCEDESLENEDQSGFDNAEAGFEGAHEKG